MQDKQTKIIYWISTGLVALFIIPGVFFLNNPKAIDGTRHLGLPYWFHLELGIAKFIGGVILVLPMIRGRLKEWVYAAFGIDAISAIIGLVSVDGFVVGSFTPLIFLAILLVSYISYSKLWPTGFRP
jgi:hypothetical protein